MLRRYFLPHSSPFIMASLRHRAGAATAALIICCRCRRLDLPCYLPPGSAQRHSSKSRCRSSQRHTDANRRFRARLALLRTALSDTLSALDSVDLVPDAADGMSLSFPGTRNLLPLLTILLFFFRLVGFRRCLLILSRMGWRLLLVCICTFVLVFFMC